MSKSLLIVPADATCDNFSFPAGIPVSRNGFNLLGVPFGSPSYCTSSVLRRVQKIQGALGSLKDLQDSQIQTTLLRILFGSLSSPGDGIVRITLLT